MIDLYNDTTGELLGPITEADLKVLVDALEEESTEDRDTSSTPPRLMSSPTVAPPSTWSGCCEWHSGHQTASTSAGSATANHSHLRRALPILRQPRGDPRALRSLGFI